MLAHVLRIRFVLVALALAGMVTPVAGDLRTTPHNLLRSQAAGGAKADPSEMCVFCHTPVIIDTQGQAPRWQREAMRESQFATYDDIGRAGTPGNTAVGSQSVACLSCHDALQAYSVNRRDGDHPFGVPYRGTPMSQIELQVAREAARAAGAPQREAQQIRNAQDFRPALSAVIDERVVWWASSTGSYQRSRADLPLYGRLNGSGETVPFIECSSCHDPHSGNKLFLRVANERSELCMTCHAK